jgi:methylated-DNA-[protein]-cysteine S-methyltransferase
MRASCRLLSSPVGELLLAATGKGLCLVEFHQGQERPSDGFTSLNEGEVRAAERELDRASAALEAYFGGRRSGFELPVDMCLVTPFVRRVLERLRRVGYGELTTYGALARAVESSPRAVGRAMASNPMPIVIPCHRVIASDGTLGGYSSGLERKRKLLALEGNAELSGGWPAHAFAGASAGGR